MRTARSRTRIPSRPPRYAPTPGRSARPRDRRAGRLGLVLAAWAVSATAMAGEPRLNQMQVIGTHNSYHIAPAPAVLETIASAGRRRAEGLDYTHRPLADQFTRLGIRQIELDV